MDLQEQPHLGGCTKREARSFSVLVTFTFVNSIPFGPIRLYIYITVWEFGAASPVVVGISNDGVHNVFLSRRVRSAKGCPLELLRVER